MARFLIATTAFPAHADWGGLLSTAKQMAAAGEQVLWATGATLVPYIREHGLRVQEVAVVDPHHGGTGIVAPPQATLSDADVWRLLLRGFSQQEDLGSNVLSSLNFLIRALADAWLQTDAVVRSTEALLRLIDDWEPDVVVAEPLMLPAALAAEARGVRLASCGYPGALLQIPAHPGLANARCIVNRRSNRIRQRLGWSEQIVDTPRLFFAAEQLQIVYLPPDWFGVLSAPPSPGAHFVGGTARASELPSTGSSGYRDRPLIVLAVSSSYLPSPDTFDNLFDGVRRIGGIALIGGPNRERAGILPDHVRWEPWLDYDAVLPRAAAIVHHGGLGTTHAAVRAAVPQVVIPGAIDQCLHADAVERAGAGISCEGTVNGAVIAERLGQVIDTHRYRQNARQLREHFERFGGVARAVELLMTLARASPQLSINGEAACG